MAAGTVTIYALCEPGTKTVRYVGKAIDLCDRIRTHWNETKDLRVRTRKANWLRSLKGTGPDLVVLEIVPYDSWASAERRWISDFKHHGFDLTNFTEGGDTSPMEGKKHSDESKKKMSTSQRAIGSKPPSQKGVRPSEEAKLKNRATHLALGTKPPPRGGWNKGIRKTHCKNGHWYSPENTRLYVRKDRNQVYQICRTCESASQKKFISKRR